MRYNIRLVRAPNSANIHAEVFRGAHKVGEIIDTPLPDGVKYFTLFFEEVDGDRFNKIAKKVYKRYLKRNGNTTSSTLKLKNNDYTEWYTKYIIYNSLHVKKWWKKIDDVLSGRAFGITYRED